MVPFVFMGICFRHSDNDTGAPPTKYDWLSISSHMNESQKPGCAPATGFRLLASSKYCYGHNNKENPRSD